jgi:hypothetical protein
MLLGLGHGCNAWSVNGAIAFLILLGKCFRGTDAGQLFQTMGHYKGYFVLGMMHGRNAQIHQIPQRNRFNMVPTRE